MQLNAILMCNLMGVNYVYEHFFILSGLWQMSKKKLTSRETYQEAKEKFSGTPGRLLYFTCS